MCLPSPSNYKDARGQENVNEIAKIAGTAKELKNRNLTADRADYIDLHRSGEKDKANLRARARL
jgi:hypothetical protein